jgi:ferredoxin
VKVWIDQDLCTGCSLCEGLVPELFAMVDGVAYVRERGTALVHPGGSGSKAEVPAHLERAVLSAAAETPGACIFIEPE